MTSFTTSVRIARGIEEVFTFVADPLGFPKWNSAVRSVHSSTGQPPELGARYVMERELPGGRVQNDVEILAREHPTSFAIHTTSGPTPLVYRYRFSPQNGHTVVELDAAFELDGVAAVLAPLARRAVKRGVADNFASLKKVLETRARPR